MVGWPVPAAEGLARRRARRPVAPVCGARWLLSCRRSCRPVVTMGHDQHALAMPKDSAPLRWLQAIDLWRAGAGQPHIGAGSQRQAACKFGKVH